VREAADHVAPRAPAGAPRSRLVASLRPAGKRPSLRGIGGRGGRVFRGRPTPGVGGGGGGGGGVGGGRRGGGGRGGRGGGGRRRRARFRGNVAFHDPVSRPFSCHCPT